MHTDRNDKQSLKLDTHHGKMNTIQLTTLDIQIPRLGSPKTKRQRIKIGPKFIHIHILPNIRIGHKLNPLLSQQIDTSVDRILLELHIGNAVHEQPPDSVGTLKDRHLVPHLIQLIRGRQPRRTGANHGHCHAGPFLGNAGHDEPLVPSVVHDGILDVLNGDGSIHQSGDAAPLTRSRADPARELREVVRLVQPLDGVGPLPVVDEVVPLGNEIVHGTARVRLAEGGAAVHAPGGLDLALDGGVLFVVAAFDGVEFFPVEDAAGGVAVGLLVALVVDEAAQFLDGLVAAVAALYSASEVGVSGPLR